MSDIRLKFKIDTKNKFDILNSYIIDIPPNALGKEGEIACIKRTVGSKIYLQIRCCVVEGTKWYDCPIIYDGLVSSNDNKILTYFKKDIENLQKTTDFSEEYLSRYDVSKNKFVFDVFPLILDSLEFIKTGFLKWDKIENKLKIDTSISLLSKDEELDGDIYIGISFYNNNPVQELSFNNQSLSLNASAST